MRMVKIESGKDKGKMVITMNDEPKSKRAAGPEPITTHNVNPLTREERRKAAAEAAKVAAAKPEPEKKGGPK